MSLEYWLQQELKFGKSAYIPWGRSIIRAIDLDDCCALYQVKMTYDAQFDRSHIYNQLLFT